jgi:nucleoside-diphosphate-sugar epimerase
MSHEKLNVLVTGGGGFIGKTIVQRLLARGHRVRNLSRSRYCDLDALGVETVQGDVSDRATVERACADCDVIFHAAAKAGVWGSYEDYQRINVVGTATCLAASQRRARCFIYTSSPSVIFNGQDMAGVTESVPYPAKHRSAYSATKAIAEQRVLAANRDDFRTIALRPHLVWGPGDNHIVPRILTLGRAGKLRIIGRGDNFVDTTYIDNAADAHLCALDALMGSSAPSGKAYFISNGEPLVVWDMINGILAAADLPPVQRRVPRPVAFAGAAVLETAHRLLHRSGEPRMTRFVVEELAATHHFDISAARSDLGYTPSVSLAEGLERLRAWLRTHAPVRA